MDFLCLGAIERFYLREREREREREDKTETQSQTIKKEYEKYI